MNGEPSPDRLALHTVTLTVSGRVLDVEECTHYVGLAPIRIWRQTHAHLLHQEDLDMVAVSFGAVRYPADDLDAVVRHVLSLIWPARHRIMEFVSLRCLNAAFVASATINDERPLYRLSPESLRRLAFFGYDFGWEVFDYS